MRRAIRWGLPLTLMTTTLLFAACGSGDDSASGTDAGSDTSSNPTDVANQSDAANDSQNAPDACVGLACDVVDCADAGTGNTTTDLHGVVYAPNGTLPLWNVSVYVPNSAPGSITHGATGSCTTCAMPLPGDPVTSTTTREDGSFVLPNVPVADNLPLVIQIGKWRKQLVLKTKPTACMPNLLSVGDTTLPKSKADIAGDVTSVDLPQIAISTGSNDALECLARKLGIADTEFTTDTGTGSVQLFADVSSPGEGANHFQAGFTGGSGAFSDSQTLWSSSAKLANYDLVLLSCEGGQYPQTKPQPALDAMKKYADMGGRIMMSHLHNIWIEGATQSDGGVEAPAVWPSIATFNNGAVVTVNGSATIDESSKDPNGSSFASWMLDAGGSSTRDIVPLQSGTGRNSCASDDDTRAETWLYLDGTNSGGVMGPQMIQFTTPNEMPVADRCGKVIFSDMHVSGDSTSATGSAFPSGCSTGGLTPQEKALAFAFFQIGSCVDVTQR